MDATIDPAIVRQVATGAAADDEIASITESRARGERSTGPVTIDTPRFEQRWVEGGTDHVINRYCVDLTQARVLDATGVDRTPADRDDRVELQIVFIADRPGSTTLLVERTKLWDYLGRC